MGEVSVCRNDGCIGKQREEHAVSLAVENMRGFMNEEKLLNHKTFVGLIASASLCSGRVLNSSYSISNCLAVDVRSRAYVAYTQC